MIEISYASSLRYASGVQPLSIARRGRRAERDHARARPSGPGPAHAARAHGRPGRVHGALGTPF